MKHLLAVLVLFGLSVHGGELAAAPDLVDFSHEVVPILRRHCVECHGGSEAKGGMSLNSRGTLLDAAVVVPGRPDQSRIIELITSTDPDEQMPPKDRPRLSDDEIAVLTRWIRQGMPWEDGFTFDESRFEPPLRPRPVELPPARDGRTNPIDRILDAYRAEHGLPPAPPLDDFLFARRVWLDIVGLLPPSEELQAFLNDPASDRHERLIRRLLDDNRAFASHWLTFWNDLLRNTYAGTGFIDDGRRQITEWLYGALLTNMPYDQFVRELITPAPGAEGFIRGIKWRGNVNSSQATEIQFAQSLGQVFLGINLKCASCHDSFIDRWTLDETYNLAAIYATTPLEIHRCDVPSGRFAQPAWLFPELGAIDANAEQPQRLRQLSELMTHPENGRLTRTIVNRIWHRMMGRGIVHPVDAMQTKPWSADLLDFLAWDFQENGYNLKHTIALIASSHAYRSEAIAMQASGATDQYVFTGPIAKRMTAEQFVDAIHSLSDTWPRPDSGAFRPDGRGQGGQLAAVVRAEERAAGRTPLEHLVGESLIREVLDQSHWLWSHADGLIAEPGETAWFRAEIPQEAADHLLIVLAVDGTAKVFVNGHRLAEHKGTAKVLIVEATHRLTAERNVVAVSAENDGQRQNPAGILLAICGMSDRGDLIWARTAPAIWRIARQPGAGWEQPTYDDATWESPVVLGNAASGPWKLTQEFSGQRLQVQRDWDALWGDRPVRAALASQDALQATLGRPNREQVVTTRPTDLTTLEAITLSNGEDMASMLREAARRIMSAEATDSAKLTESLYWSALARRPTQEELAIAAELLGAPPTQEGVEDLLWAVVMLPEFQLVR